MTVSPELVTVTVTLIVPQAEVEPLLVRLTAAVQEAAHVVRHASTIAPLTEGAARALQKALEDLHFAIGFVHGVQTPPEE